MNWPKGGTPPGVRPAKGEKKEVAMAMRTQATASGSLVQRIIGGVVGGIAGGLIFGVLMAMMGMLPMVAMVVGSESAIVGLLPLPHVQQRHHWCRLRPNLRQPEPHLWSGSTLGPTLRSHLVGVRSTGSYAAAAGDGLAVRYGLHSADAHEPARTPDLRPPNRAGVRSICTAASGDLWDRSETGLISHISTPAAAVATAGAS